MKFPPFIYLFIFIAAFVAVPCQAKNLGDNFLYETDTGDFVRVDVTVITVEGNTRDVQTHWIPNSSSDRTTNSQSDPLNFGFSTATHNLMTSRGDFVISGYFYVDPNDTNWGDVNNPDLYIKVWHDASGRIDVNCFHVSVPDITCTASLYDFNSFTIIPGSQASGTATLNNRFVQLQLPAGGSSFILK